MESEEFNLEMDEEFNEEMVDEDNIEEEIQNKDSII